MRFLIHLLAMIAVALAVGFGLSYYALGDGRLFGALRVGPWLAWPAIGATSPDPYTRAYLARSGTLPLGQGEGVTFAASGDSQGRPLDRSCRYRLQGTTPPAGFWTIQAVSLEGVNIASKGMQMAFDSRHVQRADDGSLLLYVSRSLAPDNWLAISGGGSFRLILNLYDPSDISGSGFSVDTLPTIVRERCGS